MVVKREPGANPGWARRCNRDERCTNVTVCTVNGKTQPRMNRKPKDLPGEIEVKVFAASADTFTSIDLPSPWKGLRHIWR